MKAIDTYCALEFQGHVVDSPKYDKKTETLEFKAKTQRHPPLLFIAKGTLAKAFKSILHYGCFIQVSASPIGHVEKVDGEKAIVITWQAKRMTVLGRRKATNLGNFTDRRILDGLTPIEGEEITDVGYVDPTSWNLFAESRAKALAEAKRRKELAKDDQNL